MTPRWDTTPLPIQAGDAHGRLLGSARHLESDAQRSLEGEQKDPELLCSVADAEHSHEHDLPFLPCRRIGLRLPVRNGRVHV